MKYWPGNGRKTFLNAHSLYFKLLGELGLVGIFTFGGYLICVFKLNFRLRKQLAAVNASPFLQGLPAMLSMILPCCCLTAMRPTICIGICGFWSAPWLRPSVRYLCRSNKLRRRAGMS